MRAFLRVVFFFAYFASSSTISLLKADPNDIVGYVFKVRGHWRLAPQFTSDLGLGYGLRNGDVIELNKPDPGAFIYVFLINGNVISRDCGKPTGDCHSRLAVLSVAKSQDMTERLQEIWRRLQPPPPHSEIVASRGLSDVQQLRDSVLPLNESWPDLKPALAGVPNGRWKVELTPVRKAHSVMLDLRWTAPDAHVSGPPVLPGLYKLRLIDDQGESTNLATVLVTRADQGSHFISDIQDARRLTRNWSDDNVREDFMDLVLLELSQEQRASK